MKQVNEKYMKAELYRSKNNRILGGVCGGIGEYFEIDPVIIRIIFVILATLGGLGIVIYLILWILVPDKNGRSVAENIAEEIKNEDSNYEYARDVSQSKKAFGLILVVFGVYLCAKRLLPDLALDQYLWPVIIMMVGLFIVLKSARNK